MKKVKKLIIGNWKMNPEKVLEAKKILTTIKKGMSGIRNTQVVMCPPHVYLSLATPLVSSSFMLGAQNAFHEPLGSYTGEVSFSQLPQFKTSMVIVGHSERRARGETDELVNKKVRSVIGAGMTAIICVGESVRDDQGSYLAFIKSQVSEALRDVSKKVLDHVVIAYEPIWAIGAKEAMPVRSIHEMSIYIKKVLRDLYGLPGDSIQILYGGSVNKDNAASIIQDGFVQGMLVGRESLQAKNFIELVRSVDTI